MILSQSGMRVWFARKPRASGDDPNLENLAADYNM